MYKSPICGVIAGIVLFNAVQLSCNKENDLEWAIEDFLQDEFVIYTTLDSIPEPIFNAIPYTSSDAVTAMADPGEDYNESDMVDNLDLPFTRLIFAGQSDQIWFIYFEVGGIARHKLLVLYKYTDGQVELVNKLVFLWAYQNAADLDELRLRIVSSNEIRLW